MSGDNVIQMAVNGDKIAFAKLYSRYKDRLYRYAYFKLGNDTDAQDAVADCIVCAYQSIGILKNDKAFDAWIFKILYRSCCAIIKRQIELKNTGNLDDRENLTFEEPGFESVELKDALKELNETDRDIVLLSAVAGFNSREIGRLLGLKPNTVRSRLSRALAKMKAFLR